MKNLYWVILSLFVLCVSCREKPEAEPVAGTNEQEVEMTLYTPLSYTRANSDDPEEEIRELDLVVCKNGTFLYSRAAYRSEYATFRSILKIDSDLTIYFFANSRDWLEEYATLFQEGELWENIYPQLLDTRPQRLTNNPWYLPMWGQLEYVTVSDQKINDLGTVSMLRSVAAAEVLFSLQNNEFVLKEGYIYYAANQGFLAPLPESLQRQGGDLVVVSPECPSQMQTTIRLEVKGLQKNSIQHAFYFYDNDVVSAAEVRRDQTRLVVGGYFNGQQYMTYYPLDFKYNGEILKPIRNHKYQIIVTAVNSEGWNTPEEAAEAAAVNIDYDVIEWEEYEDENIGIDGPDYVSIQKKKIQLYREDGSTGQISLHTSYPLEKLEMEFVEHYNGITQTETALIRNDRFEVRILTDANGEVAALLFTALQDYDPSDVISNSQTLRLTAGRIRFDISIIQIDYNSDDWDEGGNEEVVLGQ